MMMKIQIINQPGFFLLVYFLSNISYLFKDFSLKSYLTREVSTYYLLSSYWVSSSLFPVFSHKALDNRHQS